MPEKSKFEDIIKYYDHTRSDYKFSWDNSKTPALHFGFYDDKATNHKDALMNTNRVLADLASIQPGEKVVDAGCGKGGSSFWLALNRNAQCIGITPVQSQIDDCLKQRSVLNLEDKVDFKLADFCNTDFESESFDVVWALESQCHAEQKSDFYKEAYRILKPNGRLIVADYIRRERPLKPSQEDFLMSWLNRWAIKDLDTTEEHLGYTDATGFRNVVIKDVTPNMKVSLRNLHRNASNWLKFGELLSILRLRSKVQLNNQIGSIIQYEALEQNLWYYAFITAIK